MIAFFCETPYAVLNAINAKRNLFADEGADIFIRNRFFSAREISLQLRKTGIFRNVFFIDLPAEKPNSLFQSRMLRFCSPGLIKKFIPSEVVETLFYKRVYIFQYGAMSWNFFEYFSQKNKKVKLFFIEEGIGSYTLDPNAFSPKTKWLHDNLNINLFSTGKVQGLYLYAPELATTKTEALLLQLPKLNRNDKVLVKIINDVFGYTGDIYTDFEKKKYVYFDQPILERDIEDDNGLEFLNSLCEIVDKKEVIVKLHPRRKKAFYSDYGFDVSFAGNIPFEVLMLNHSFEDKILISEMSTALISPKMIFNDEPKVCATYKQDARSGKAMGKGTFKMFLEQYEQLFLNCRNSYKDYTQFVICGDIDVFNSSTFMSDWSKI